MNASNLRTVNACRRAEACDHRTLEEGLERGLEVLKKEVVRFADTAFSACSSTNDLRHETFNQKF